MISKICAMITVAGVRRDLVYAPTYDYRACLARLDGRKIIITCQLWVQLIGNGLSSKIVGFMAEQEISPVTPASPPRLGLEGIGKSFGGRCAVEGATFTVAGGEVTCLLGPSGCGKTTMLRMIAGLETPDCGTISMDGRLICAPSGGMPPEERQIGMMFQDFALFPHLTVGQNVSFGLSGQGRREAKKNRSICLEWLERVNLCHAVDEYPHVLSGGEQQRVALVRALAPRPRLMLMDEPFSGLDNRLRDAIRDDMLSILKDEDTSVILVTHDPYEAMRMADQIILMREGQIIQKGAPYNLYNRPVDKESVAFFSDINVLVGTVQGSLCQTPFGQFFAPGYADGTKVEIVFRPQHVRIDFDRAGRGPHPTQQDGTAARAKVARARFLGRESLIEFDLCEGEKRILASVPNVFLPAEGATFWLTIPRARCFVFARG